MKPWLVIAIVTVGCGGSQRARDPAAEAREAERKRIEAMEPASPYEPRVVRGYRAPTTCGQGPYRIETPALGAQFGEQLEVSICAPRSLQGDYRLTKGTDRGEPRHFGSRNNSEHCVANAAEAAQRGAPATGAAASNGRTSTTSSATASAGGASVEAAAPVALVPITESIGMTGAIDEKCPGGMYLTGIVDYRTESTEDGVPWKPGMQLVVDVWSAEPLHLDGAIFVVIQRGVRADMTRERWIAYREEKERWYKIWSAYLDGEVTAGRVEYADMTARSDAPPAPRVDIKPPKPSTNAEWIAGYWQRDREWIWSPGFWRVPEADIVAERTIEAPVAPPPVKVEAPPPAPVASVSASATITVSASASAPPTAASPPTAAAPIASAPAAPAVTMVWTPGYWAWNGTAYIWIEGAWRIPPKAGARWVAPSWTPRRGRVVLQPGGWSVRIGR